MRDLFIYHPESGISISLSDEVYMIDVSRLSYEEREDLQFGTLSAADAYSVGICLDNFNMTNLFFGG